MEAFPANVTAHPLQSTENVQNVQKRHRGEPEKVVDYLWWASQKKMKKAGVLYTSEWEDRIVFPQQYPIAWTTLRQLQCREDGIFHVVASMMSNRTVSVYNVNYNTLHKQTL